jgi:Txe/YoeB family toxin of Txe-Axe toxin-antitoxin module
MQYYYGNQMPLRILDEAEFWKHQEEEHTVVIRELVKNLETEYVKALKEWEKVLSETHQRVIRFMETVIRSGYVITPAVYQEVLQLVKFCLDQSEQFIEFCRQIRDQSEALKDNLTAKVVINHIIRESEYFIGIAQTILYQQ